jgi:hypothetical protein
MWADPKPVLHVAIGGGCQWRSVAQAIDMRIRSDLSVKRVEFLDLGRRHLVEVWRWQTLGHWQDDGPAAERWTELQLAPAAGTERVLVRINFPWFQPEGGFTEIAWDRVGDMLKDWWRAKKRQHLEIRVNVRLHGAGVTCAFVARVMALVEALHSPPDLQVALVDVFSPY